MLEGGRNGSDPASTAAATPRARRRRSSAGSHPAELGDADQWQARANCGVRDVLADRRRAAADRLPIGWVRGIPRTQPPEQADALLEQRLGREIAMWVLRLDEDSGRIIVSGRVSAARQLPLPWFGA
jgi:hypothetical protein